MLPEATSCDASRPCATTAVRTPRFCCMRGLMLTPPLSAPPLPLPAYTGASIMSMKGDLPGASKRVPGVMGSW